MSGGILDFLPQMTGGGGILDSLNNTVTNNRDALMGLGGALLGGQGWGAATQGYLQGAQMDQRTRLIQQQQAQQAQKQQAAQAIATKMGTPELAGDPDTALGLYKAMQLLKAQQSAPTELTRTLEAAGYKPGTPEFQAIMRTQLKAQPTYGEIGEDPNTGAKVYGWRNPVDMSTTPTMLPGQAQPTDTPPGIDPKEYRKARAEQIAKNEASNTGAADDAQTALNALNQMKEQWAVLAKNGGIGPTAASGLNRTITGALAGSRFDVTGGGQNEIARQKYDQARATLSALITRARNKGQGQVSNMERALMARPIPDLDAADPSVGTAGFNALQADLLRSIQMDQQHGLYRGQQQPQGQSGAAGAPTQADYLAEARSRGLIR